MRCVSVRNDPGVILCAIWLGMTCSNIDLDRDADVQELLERFGVTISELPVLICCGRLVVQHGQ